MSAWPVSQGRWSPLQKVLSHTYALWVLPKLLLAASQFAHAPLIHSELVLYLMTVRKPISFFHMWASSFSNSAVESNLSSSVYSWYLYGLVDGICYLTHTHTGVLDMVLPVTHMCSCVGNISFQWGRLCMITWSLKWYQDCLANWGLLWFLINFRLAFFSLFLWRIRWGFWLAFPWS